MNTTDNTLYNYAGFWVRTWASAVDTGIIVILITPMLITLYGEDFIQNPAAATSPWSVFLNWVFPALLVISFWFYKSATPGKMLFRLTIVDAKTGKKPSAKQFFIRYAGYILSCLPFLLGILWVAQDEKKQGWHDKMANTYVLRY